MGKNVNETVNTEAMENTEAEATATEQKKSKIKEIGKKVWNKTIDVAKVGVVFAAGVAAGVGASYLYGKHKEAAELEESCTIEEEFDEANENEEEVA